MKKTIILVEDDDMLSEGLQIVLEEEDYTVIALLDGTTLLKKIQETSPNMLLIDYWLPGLDGSTLIKKIRAREQMKHIPIILMSANQKNMHQIAKDLGAQAFLGKPFETETLLGVIDKFIQ